MRTVIGILADELGAAFDLGSHRRAWSSPAAEYRSVQRKHIPVDRDHDGRWVGELRYLERNAGNLWAVAELDAEPFVRVRVGGETRSVEAPMYWSAERYSTPQDTDVILRSVAIVSATARVAARPLRWCEGDLSHRGGWHGLSELEQGLVRRAGEANLKRFGKPGLVIHDETPVASDPARTLAGYAHPGPLLTRSAELVDVSTPTREIDLVVAPYESPALVPHQGRMVEEVLSVGAFAAEVRRAGRIRVNRDHDLKRLVGHATALEDHPAGLLGTVRLARTELADETLELARSGCLDASVGFLPVADRWEGRRRHRIDRAHLGHIALVPEPAYEDARVLAVDGSALAV
jgi:HK97 family phage prohead protease